MNDSRTCRNEIYHNTSYAINDVRSMDRYVMSEGASLSSSISSVAVQVLLFKYAAKRRTHNQTSALKNIRELDSW